MSTNELKKRIRTWHRLDAMMLVAIVLLALLVPAEIIKGEYLDALCNCLWVFIGVKYYQSSENVTEITADSLSLIETYDKLVDELKRTIVNVAVAKSEEEKQNK